jgi:hypothetical protein
MPTDYTAILLEVFRHFRAHGIEPHPREYYDGSAVVSEDVDLHASDEAWATALGENLAEADTWGAGPALSEEERVRPRRQIGLTEMMHVVGFGETAGGWSDRVSVRVAQQRGWFYQMLSDEVKLGVGLIRRFGSGPMAADLDWRSLATAISPDASSAPIPEPRTLRERLSADAFSAFARFTIFAIFCDFKGLCLCPTLFDYGGGSASTGTPPAGGAALAGAERTFRPAAWTQGLYPSDGGWDAWYWDLTRAESGGELVPAGLKLLHQYALFLRAPPDSEFDGYWTECCRRKSLGLMAFGLTVGAYLTLLQTVLRSCVHLPVREATRLIPYLLIGNEMDAFLATGYDSPDDFAPYMASTQEMAWFHALVAVPIHVQAPLFRFGMADLSSTQDSDTFYAARNSAFAWLQVVLTAGLPEALTHPDLGSLAEELDLSESLPSLVPGDLVSIVGVHWYHHAEREIAWDPGTGRLVSDDITSKHLEDTRLMQDCIAFRERVVSACLTSAYAQMTWWISEIGFPAEGPWSSEQLPSSFDHLPSLFNTQTSPRVQAIHVARRLLAMKAVGVPSLCWFCDIGVITGDSRDEDDRWRIFNTMGLRSDIVTNVSFSSSGWWTTTRDHPNLSTSFKHGENAVRRPAWYTFRRVAWLLSRSRQVELLHMSTEDEAVVLRLLAADAEGFWRSGFRYLYVAWMDFSSPYLLFSFLLRGPADEAGHRVVSLVPEIDYGAHAGHRDENGYPAADPMDPDAGFLVDWDGEGFDEGGAVTRVRESAGFIETTIVVYRAMDLLGGSVQAPPFCLLSNAGFEGVFDT